MNTEDKFIRFIDKFNCGCKQLIKRGHILDTQSWNLRVNARKTFFIDQAPPYPTPPLSIVLDGVKVNTSVFGIRRDYNPYVCMSYPYLQLERMFLLHPATLHTVFMQGFCIGNSRGKNTYDVPEFSIAFDLSRFFLQKYFGAYCSYTHRDFFQ